MPPFATPLSVLDLAPVGAGQRPGDALRNSIDLVQHAERLGLRRHWVAEHHNMPGIASSSPALLLAHLASATTTIRVGSGGVMLPNHAPLAVAEQFGTLEALHPGRIDLGLGRAPGTDPVTARALRRGPASLAADDFPEAFGDLIAFFNGTFPADHPYARVRAVPGLGDMPALWLLGSSDYSAQLAGLVGLPFSFAHHFAAVNTVPAVTLYRRHFQPSAWLGEPYVMLGVNVVCAGSDEEARWLAGSSELAFLNLRSGRPDVLPTPETAAAHQWTPAERRITASWMESTVIGGPETVRSRLEGLVSLTGADELIVTTMVHSHQARMQSYSLLAEMAADQPMLGMASRPS